MRHSAIKLGRQLISLALAKGKCRRNEASVYETLLLANNSQNIKQKSLNALFADAEAKYSPAEAEQWRNGVTILAVIL